MNTKQFHTVLRRALEIKTRAEAAFGAARAVQEELTHHTQALRLLEQELLALRNDPGHRAGRILRAHVDQEIQKQLELIEERKVVIEVTNSVLAECRAQTQILAPQRDSVMQHIETLRRERTVAAAKPYVSDKSSPYAFEVDTRQVIPMDVSIALRGQS